MANQGAKKRKEENSSRLKNLLRFIIFSNVFYLVVRAGIFHSTFKWKHWVGFMLNLFTYVIPYQQLAMRAKPTYSENGELEDGGFDLTTDGVCGYLHDVIYITGFVQLTTIISEKFWYIYLVIPTFAAYKLLGFVKGFMSLGSEAGIFHSTFKWKHWVGFMLNLFAYVIPYQHLAMMAKPTYSESGELEDSGFDLTTDGFCGYLHDVIYITGFVQLTTIIFEKFWYIYLVIPTFAAYKLLGFVKGFMLLGLEGPKEDEKSRKKRDKMERKASRPKFARTRN